MNRKALSQFGILFPVVATSLFGLHLPFESTMYEKVQSLHFFVEGVKKRQLSGKLVVSWH